MSFDGTQRRREPAATPPIDQLGILDSRDPMVVGARTCSGRHTDLICRWLRSTGA